jgi:hypothetical protein
LPTRALSIIHAPPHLTLSRCLILPPTVSLFQVVLLDEYSTLCMWLLPVFAFVHLLVFLSAHWSNNVRAFLRFRRRSVRA